MFCKLVARFTRTGGPHGYKFALGGCQAVYDVVILRVRAALEGVFDLRLSLFLSL